MSYNILYIFRHIQFCTRGLWNFYFDMPNMEPDLKQIVYCIDNARGL